MPVCVDPELVPQTGSSFSSELASRNHESEEEQGKVKRYEEDEEYDEVDGDEKAIGSGWI